MAKVAVVKDDEVINIIVIDDINALNLPGCDLIEQEDVSIGDYWNGEFFTPKEKPTPIELTLAELQEQQLDLAEAIAAIFERLEGGA